MENLKVGDLGVDEGRVVVLKMKYMKTALLKKTASLT